MVYHNACIGENDLYWGRTHIGENIFLLPSQISWHQGLKGDQKTVVAYKVEAYTYYPGVLR